MELLATGAERSKLSFEQYATAVRNWMRDTATERSDKEVREAAKPELMAMFQANPQADLDPREAVGRLGLKNCQADRAWFRAQWKRLRLTYQGAPVAPAAAD